MEQPSVAVVMPAYNAARLLPRTLPAVIEAAGANEAPHTAHEAADLLFHVCVLLAHADVPFDQVLEVLEGRFGVSGLAEKAARKSSSESE